MLHDYIFGKILGEGSFGTVYLAKNIQNHEKCAIKVYDKSHIIKEGKVQNVNQEKDLLIMLSRVNKNNNNYFIKLLTTFQDPKRLFFVLSYSSNGDLLKYIKTLKAFNLKLTKFYTAEIVSALEFLHKIDIVHQDLKPSNILLDDKMHIQIADFNSAKCLKLPCKNIKTIEDVSYMNRIFSRRRYQSLNENVHKIFPKRSYSTLDGTAQFLSPEQINDNEVTTSSDLWALGCVIFYMATGRSAFTAKNMYDIFEQIINTDYSFPDSLDESVKSIIKQFLVLQPKKRLGGTDTLENGYPSIRKHCIFNGLNFKSLYQQTPPFMNPFIPGTDKFDSIKTDFDFSEDLQPGLNENQAMKLFLNWDS